MPIAPSDDCGAHPVSLNSATAEDPEGLHRLIGGGVEPCARQSEALLEIEEELHATFRDLRFLAAVETIFHFNGAFGHGIVFVDVGRLDPLPLYLAAAAAAASVRQVAADRPPH